MPVHLVVAWGSLLASCGYAAWRGGGPERAAAAMFVAAAFATHFIHPAMSKRYQSIDVGAAIVDAALLICLLRLVIVANRYWPMWIAALQAIGTASHLLGLAHERFLTMTYALLSQLEVYPMLVILVWGTAEHRRRLRNHGVDRSWSMFSGPSQPTPMNSQAG